MIYLTICFMGTICPPPEVYTTSDPYPNLEKCEAAAAKLNTQGVPPWVWLCIDADKEKQ